MERAANAAALIFLDIGFFVVTCWSIFVFISMYIILVLFNKSSVFSKSFVWLAELDFLDSLSVFGYHCKKMFH